jgi:hypothetical protein
VYSLLFTCYEVAEQIPYAHASMTKLVSLIYGCLNSSRLARRDDDRYQMLGEALRDWWDSMYTLLRYTSLLSMLIPTQAALRPKTQRST